MIQVTNASSSFRAIGPRKRDQRTSLTAKPILDQVVFPSSDGPCSFSRSLRHFLLWEQGSGPSSQPTQNPRASGDQNLTCPLPRPVHSMAMGVLCPTPPSPLKNQRLTPRTPRPSPLPALHSEIPTIVTHIEQTRAELGRIGLNPPPHLWSRIAAQRSRAVVLCAQWCVYLNIYGFTGMVQSCWLSRLAASKLLC